MASRRDIRQAFYDALETAASGFVPADNIKQIRPETTEDLPAIVHRDDYTKIPINDGSSAPTELVRDDAGNVTQEVFETLHEASFGVTFIDSDEGRREDTYEAVRKYFERYQHAAWDSSSLHADVQWVEVLNSTSEDDTDVTPTNRGDRLIIRLGFTREHEHDVTATSTVNRTVD